MKEFFYSKEDGKVKCWLVLPNSRLPGHYTVADCKTDACGYSEVRPLYGDRYRAVHGNTDGHYFTNENFKR